MTLPADLAALRALVEAVEELTRPASAGRRLPFRDRRPVEAALPAARKALKRVEAEQKQAAESTDGPAGDAGR